MKIAVITGASSGLGAEYVRVVCATRGELDEIWVIARRADRLHALKGELGEKIRPVPLDITAPVCADTYTNLLKANNAEVMLLINCAGYGKLGNFDELDTADNTGMVRLNCEALTLMSSLSLPFMPENSEIVNVCSIASFAPNSRMAVYCSTKAFVLSLSRCMRAELKRRKINTIAVCLGPMDTEFLGIANIEKGTSHTFDTLPRVDPKGAALRSLKASTKGRAVYTDRAFYKFYRIIAKILPHSIVMKMSAT